MPPRPLTPWPRVVPGARGRRRRSPHGGHGGGAAAVLCSSGAHLHRIFYRVLRAVHSVLTFGRFVAPNPIQEPPEMTVSGKDLRQVEREDAVACLKPLLE